MGSIKALLQVTPPTVPITTFSPGFFVVLQEILYQPSFTLIRLRQKVMNFQSKTNYFFKLVAGRF